MNRGLPYAAPSNGSLTAVYTTNRRSTGLDVTRSITTPYVMSCRSTAGQVPYPNRALENKTNLYRGQPNPILCLYHSLGLVSSIWQRLSGGRFRDGEHSPRMPHNLTSPSQNARLFLPVRSAPYNQADARQVGKCYSANPVFKASYWPPLPAKRCHGDAVVLGLRRAR